MKLSYERYLPLLEIEKEQFQGVDLSNVLLICVQHICSTTYALFQALFERGLQRKNLFVLGKCYSTDPKIYYQLVNEGVMVSEDSIIFNSHLDYDKEFDNSVGRLLKKCIETRGAAKYEKIIVLDDGGHLIERTSAYFSNNSNIIGIEQTSSGYNRLKSWFQDFSVINTSRSWLKLQYESPIIVDLVIKKLFMALEVYTTLSHKILLIGNGALGSQVYNRLKSSFDITLFDNMPERSEISISEIQQRLADFDIIIGCTGYTSLTREDLNFLKPGTLLASISSSDREFGALDLRKRCKIYNDCHKNLFVDGIWLLNSGFPISFGNDYRSIDVDDFQLTRAMLFSSIFQAVLTSTKRSGFIEFDHQIQSRILQNWEEINAGQFEKSDIGNRCLTRAG